MKPTTFAGHVKATATQTFGAIPKERLSTKIQKTLVGIGLVASAGGVVKYLPAAPWYVSVSLLLAGAHIASGELVGKTVKFFVDLGVGALKRNRE